MVLHIRRSVGIAGAVLFLAAVARTLHARSSRAGSSTSPPTPAVETDFFQDLDANHEAAQLGHRLRQELADFAEYAGLRIVSDGIELSLVGSPTPEVKAIVARESRLYRAQPIPVRYRSVSRPLRELEAVRDRITADHGYWQQQGVELSTWGTDLESNTVNIRLAHSTKAYADALTTRYGDAVTVYPHD